MEYIQAFIAGFASTLMFHQGAMAALHRAGFWPKPPFAMTPTAPFQVPAVISLAFWGGLWGIALWLVIGGLPPASSSYWGLATVLGALGPSAVALLVVFPLKGLPMAGGGDPKVITCVLILNAAWGFGVALLMRLMASLG